MEGFSSRENRPYQFKIVFIDTGSKQSLDEFPCIAETVFHSIIFWRFSFIITKRRQINCHKIKAFYSIQYISLASVRLKQPPDILPLHPLFLSSSKHMLITCIFLLSFL